MGANTGIISKPRNISVSVSEYNTQTSKIFRFSVSGLNETAWMKNSWNDTAHDIGSQRNKSTRSTHTVEQKFDKIVRTRRISVSMGEVHRQIPANHSGTNQSRGSRDESKVAKEKKEMKGNAWSWIARGARQLQTLQSWVTLRRERQRGTERERERERRGGEKKLFPQVVYWQIQFPDQRWMAGVVCASIESRFSSTVCIRCSFYDGYERRACSRDRSPMNFSSIPFSVNNLNPASSKGEKRRVWETGRKGGEARPDKVYEMSCVSLSSRVSYILDQSALLFLIQPAISHSARIDPIRETEPNRIEPELHCVASPVRSQNSERRSTIAFASRDATKIRYKSSRGSVAQPLALASDSRTITSDQAVYNNSSSFLNSSVHHAR